MFRRIARPAALWVALTVVLTMLVPAHAALAATVRAGTPSITGTVQVGKTLTAKPGTWKPSGVRLTFQWYRSGKKIKGATGPTYTLVAADKGKTVKVKVTGSKAGYSKKSRYSKSTRHVAAGTLTIGTLGVSGGLEVGSLLTASTGPLGSGVKVTYRWLRGGAAIAGQTAASYRLTAADAGLVVTLSATFTRSGYKTVTRAWNTGLRVMKTATPSVSGSATVGSTLTASPGSWSAGTTLSYQWLRSNSAIVGATAQTYKVQSADVGHSLAVRLTAQGTGYPTVQKVSSATATVPAVAPPPPPPLTAAGYGTTGTRTQRMSDASLGSTQAGWYEANVRLGLACYKRGQSVKGFYSWSIPGGWSDLWYKVVDGYFVADVDLNTGTSNPVAPPCDGGGSAGSLEAKVDAFVAKYRNTFVNVDGAYGAQCTDLFNRYHMDLKGGSYVRMGGNGGAKNLWTTTNAQMLNWYTRIGSGDTARKGDIAVFNNGEWGHVAIVLADQGASLRVFHQNDCATNAQGVNNCPAREGTLSKSGLKLLGYFRPNP